MSRKNRTFSAEKCDRGSGSVGRVGSGNALTQAQAAALLSDAIRVGAAAARVPGWFWDQVDMSAGPDACWLWTGKLDKDGYGRAGGLGRSHRVACEIAHGPAPADGMHACHSTRCESRRCSNPGHMRWDTPAGNQADVAITGSRRGVRHPLARLTEAQVREIWARRRDGYVTVARALGTPVAATRHVIDGSNWSHITQAVAS